MNAFALPYDPMKSVRVLSPLYKRGHVRNVREPAQDRTHAACSLQVLGLVPTRFPTCWEWTPSEKGTGLRSESQGPLAFRDEQRMGVVDEFGGLAWKSKEGVFRREVSGRTC